GTLDAEAAAILRAALDPLTAPRPAGGASNPDSAGADNAGSTGGTADSGGGGERDRRSPARRRADALIELITRALHTDTLPTQGGYRPHVTVLAPLPALLGEPGAPPADNGWGLPLPATVLARLLCDAELVRLLLDPTGVPLDIGRTQRIVPPALRRALIARDRCCTYPGCDRPPGWCEAHHIIEWSHGGHTALNNLVLTCGQHHRTLHHS
ncbi:HNH endonuclease signature motif containing protein, partial [Frankia sp. Cas4]|uniref:HNH endonuclease signature motif containing protein n=1 Tax=Frankia sp. Cas4 TaxID=3073927 RepID=UPI002AD3D3E8